MGVASWQKENIFFWHASRALLFVCPPFSKILATPLIVFLFQMINGGILSSCTHTSNNSYLRLRSAWQRKGFFLPRLWIVFNGLGSSGNIRAGWSIRPVSSTLFSNTLKYPSIPSLVDALALEKEICRWCPQSQLQVPINISVSPSVCHKFSAPSSRKHLSKITSFLVLAHAILAELRRKSTRSHSSQLINKVGWPGLAPGKLYLACDCWVSYGVFHAV